MDKFTVKDFIAHNNPCFSCGSKITFKIGDGAPRYQYNFYETYVSSELISVNLKKRYNGSLDLFVYPKNNKFETNEKDELIELLKINNLYLYSYCEKCKTTLYSEYLKFNFDKEYIEPVSINYEILIVYDGNSRYELSYNSVKFTGKLLVDNPSVCIDVENYSLSYLKTRENFINKVKTLILLS